MNYRLLIVSLLLTLLSLGGYAQGKEAYAVLNSGTLTFYYNSSIPSDAYGMNTDINNPGWTVDEATAATITTVKFDASFADYLPKSCAYWFFKCKNLTQIVGIENLKTKDVQYFKAMFSDCPQLQSVDLSGFNTAKAIDISCMFRRTVFKSLDLSTFNTENVKEFSSMFEGCSTLQSVDLSSFNTKSATSFRCMFIRCSALTTLDLSGFDTQSSPVTAQMFQYCSSLKTIYVGDSWSNATITETGQMFYACSNLVGGKGSAFASLGDSKTYARIDGGSENPGYFTKSGEPEYVPADSEPYVVIKDGTATFYYNNTKPEDALPIQTSQKDANWTEDVQNSVTKVVFDKSFKNYKPTRCDCWFYKLKNLTEISGMKEYLNTEDVWSMRTMFCGCSSLTSIDVSNFKTENVNDMAGLFDGCSALTTLDISNFTTEKVKYMGYMFSGCSGITTLDVSNFNTENVTEMAFIFSRCRSLTTLDLSNFNTAKVTKMNYLFENCENLRTIFVKDDWNVSSVTESGFMFYSCNNLYGGKGTAYNRNFTDLTYAHIDGGAENPGYFTKSGEPAYTPPVPYVVVNDGTLTFYYNNKKPSDAYELNDTENKPDWGSSAENITKVVFDESFAEYKPTSCFCWFNGFKNLTTIVDIKNLKTDEVASFKGMFQDCTILESVDLSGFNTSKATDISCMFRRIACKKLDLSSFNTEKVTDFGSMFEGCSALEEVDLHTFNTKSASSFWSMFTDCSKLTELDLLGFDTQSNPRTGHMFQRCAKLTTIYVGGSWNNGSVVDDELMFHACGSLVGSKGTAYDENHFDATYARIDGGTENPGYFTKSGDKPFEPSKPYVVVNDGTLTFYYNSSKPSGAFDLNDTKNKPDWESSAESITKVVFDESFAEYRPTSCYCWFNGFKNLTTIVGIENLITDQVTSFKGMFQDCPQLQSVDLSGFNTANATDISCMFRRTTFKKLDLSSFTTEDVTDFGSMFEDCSSLEEVDLHTFDTKSATNFWCMFLNCRQLTELDLPGFDTQSNPKTGHMFQGCTSLTTIFVGDSWANGSITDAELMFYDCGNLVGGKGTTLTYIDDSYAHIDGGKEDPGYFTKSGEPAFKKVLESIAVTTSPKIEYTEGDDFSTENGVLTLTYNTGNPVTINLSEATITGYDKTKVGEQTVTIAYQGVETTLVVTVATPTPVSSVPEASSVKVWSYNSAIFIESAPDTKYTIIDLSGRVLKSSATSSSKEEIRLNQQGIVVVIINGVSYKLSL